MEALSPSAPGGGQVKSPLVSVVMPVLNEAATLDSVLRRLSPLMGPGHELIVVDGGSTDATVEIATRYASEIVCARAGRAHQMNAGAAVARGSFLVFLHADTALPRGALEFVTEALRHAEWGRFDVRLSGSHPAFRIIERMMCWRSRWSGIATGDQAVFVRSESFRAVGGFPEMPLMEDVYLSRCLLARGRPACLRQRVVTSSRRWEAGGIVRTVLLMWTLRAAYACGVSPQRLAQHYRAHGDLANRQSTVPER